MKTDRLPLQTYLVRSGIIGTCITFVRAKSRNHAMTITRDFGLRPTSAVEYVP